MFCTIIKKKMKKLKYKGNVYRKIEWKPWSDDPLSGHCDETDLIERDLKDKWDIILNESFRENGRIKKKQQHICTVSYWDIVDGWADEDIYWRLEKLYPDPEKQKEVSKLIYDKFQSIIDQVAAEYKKSEEYKYKKKNEEFKKAKEKEINGQKKYQEDKYKYDSYYGQGYYDAHFNRDGSTKFNSSEAKEWDEAHKSNNGQNSYNYGDYSSYNWGQASTGSVLQFTENEKAIVQEFIKEGFRVMTLKHHPDKGGDEEYYKRVIEIKDKLNMLI